MTKFTKENLKKDGDYLLFTNSDNKSTIVARFKYGAKTSIPSFRKFLIDNFTVEEYFERIINDEMPLNILKSKGYLSLHIRQWLKRDGFPQTLEGYKLFKEKAFSWI